MKNVFYNIAFMVFVSLSGLSSCRDSTDIFSSYFDENLYSDTTYVGQFKLFWTFMECNYPMWDYEAAMGVDWDDVYVRYLPRFEELDKNESIVSGERVEELYTQIVTPLHDGHMYIDIRHPNQYDTVSLYEKAPFIINKYITSISCAWLKNRPDYPKYEEGTKELNVYYDQISQVYPTEINSFSDYYLKFFDNILYFHPQKTLDKGYVDYQEKNMETFWKEWFNEIEKLYKTRKLKGIILDLRWVQGGSNENFHYVMGALQPINLTNGYHRLGWVRHKSGIGRYDYSPLTPMLYIADSNYQLNITDIPIIVLSNCYTGSLGEMICLAAKHLRNGMVVGMRTAGALGYISTIQINGVDANNNCVLGKQGKTSLYVVVPNATFFTDDKEILDGKGIVPDIEVELDLEEYESTGRDTQLERALEFIRKGK